MYNAPANGLAEAFNKTLCNLLKKVVGRTKKDWHERINEALWAYWTTYRTPTQATPLTRVWRGSSLASRKSNSIIEDGSTRGID
ncbi:unnamed protein product [Prunus brigantina]